MNPITKRNLVTMIKRAHYAFQEAFEFPAIFGIYLYEVCKDLDYKGVL